MSLDNTAGDPRDWVPTDQLPAPPSSTDAERQLLSVILFKPEFINDVADIIEEKHFSEPAFGIVWTVFRQFADHNKPISPELIVEPLMQNTGWDRTDTMKALVVFMKSAIAPVRSQAIHYARYIRDLWVRRELYEVAGLIQQDVRIGQNRTAAEVLESVEAKVFAISTENDSNEKVQTLGEALQEAMQQAQAAALAHESGELVGVTTGLSAIDSKLGGLRNTDFIVVGARPGMGKTALLTAVSVAAAEQAVADNPERPEWVYIFSLEMAANQLALRMACAKARVSFEKVRLGQITVEEMMRLQKAVEYLRDLPIRIDDSARASVPAMRTRLRRWKRKHGLRLCAIDYLQLIDLAREEMRTAGDNRVHQISHITRNLKALAKEMDVPLLALAQLSREVEKRDDKRPQLSDLRESGTIEQDADVVAFLYREAYYLAKRPPQKKDREAEIDYGTRRTDWAVALDKCRDRAEFIIAKNRHGSEGIRVLKFEPELMLFEDDTPGDATQGVTRKQQLAMDLMAEP